MNFMTFVLMRSRMANDQRVAIKQVRGMCRIPTHNMNRLYIHIITSKA